MKSVIAIISIGALLVAGCGTSTDPQEAMDEFRAAQFEYADQTGRFSQAPQLELEGLPEGASYAVLRYSPNGDKATIQVSVDGSQLEERLDINKPE